MNIKDFYKTIQQDLDEKTKEFSLNKKQIKKMIEQGKKNGEEINFICNEILDNIYAWNRGDLLAFDFGYLEANIEKIQNIVGGSKDE